MADLGPRFAAGVKNSLKIATTTMGVADMANRQVPHFVGFSTACHVKVSEFIFKAVFIPCVLPGTLLAVKPKYIVLLR